jgi:hypothetical protein
VNGDTAGWRGSCFGRMREAPDLVRHGRLVDLDGHDGGIEIRWWCFFKDGPVSFLLNEERWRTR